MSATAAAWCCGLLVTLLLTVLRPGPRLPAGLPARGRARPDRRAVRRGARRTGVTASPALLADLVAAMLVAGLPPSATLRLLRRSIDELDLSPPHGLEPLLEALQLAESTGLAPAGLVQEAAGALRRNEAVARRAATARLAVLVVLPTGLCLLPAFFLLTVAPFVLGLFGGLRG